MSIPVLKSSNAVAEASQSTMHSFRSPHERDGHRLATCMVRSGLKFDPSPRNSSLTWELMSIPQFSSSPSGFASRCDWVIGSRFGLYKRIPKHSSWGNIKMHPRTIFVRSDLVGLFYRKVLPCLSKQFVLITGDHDATVPRQVDPRYAKYISRKD